VWVPPSVKWNIFVGYSYTRAKVFPGSGPVGAASNQTGNLNGWDGSLEGKVFPFIGIVADVSGHYGSREFTIGCEAIPTPPCVPQTANVHANLHTYLFGPRASVSVGRFTPFAQALFGAAHISESASSVNFSHSDTSFATAIGGGIDYKLFPAVAWRFQGDWLQTRVLSSTQSNLRLSTGIVLRF
jgi:opacity protein-like surface antigen